MTLSSLGQVLQNQRKWQDAEAVLREALAMYGRSTPEYIAIFNAIKAQTQGLIDQGLAPLVPATLLDVRETLQMGQATAQQQMEQLLAKVDTMSQNIEKQTIEMEGNTTAVAAQTSELVDATEASSRTIERAVQSQPSPGARLV